ncbi:WD40-repeat-containing domain protein [Lipomyces japonicus]|uniref:WD40-repeat-containing domain protein n=1 Tax=Lipomyces japonicus TaxID=56871 RepID=UPI0034CF4061
MQSNKPSTTISFSDTIFCSSVHPSKALLATGLSTGHVFMQRYAPDDEDNGEHEIDDSDNDEDFNEQEKEVKLFDVKRMWKTRRHKGSCRALTFDENGNVLYSVGSDSVLKQASAETGRVIAKSVRDIESEPTALQVTSTHILVGDENSTLKLFDPRTVKPTHTFTECHDDYITSISHLAQYQNSYQLITTGSTTVTRIDIRKGKLLTSEDQEDEILCSTICYPSYFEYNPSTGVGVNPDKRVPVIAVMGMATGVLTFWEKNNWEDQQSRAKLSDESIDCVAEYPGEKVIAGGADGYVRLLDARSRKRLRILEHGGEDGVQSVSADAFGRIISTGGEVVKIWNEHDDEEKKGKEKFSDSDSDDDGEDDSDSDDSDSSDDGKKKKKKKQKKRKRKGKTFTAPKPSRPKPSFAGLD